MKRFLLFMLSLLLTVSVPFTASHALEVNFGAVKDGIYTYTVEDSKATIVDVDDSLSGEVVIPSTLGGYPVVSMQFSAFSGLKTLTSVTMPEGIISIGYGAFENCSNLKTINFPDSLKYLAENLFENTAWYDSQPDGIVYAGKVAYKYKGDCPKSVVIKEGTVSIGSHAFSECVKLESIVIPDSVTTISAGAFYGCTSLSDITIPEDIEEVSDFAFEGTPWFDNLPDGIIYFGKMAYKYKGVCPETVEIKSGTTILGNSVFEGCYGLKTVVLPSSIERIEDFAFAECTSLENINIPEGVTYIGDWSFYLCENLKTIVIPDSVTVIGEYLFRGCTSLSDVKLSDNLKVISGGTFSGCESLESVIIPEGVIDIWPSAFQSCYSLDNVVIPDTCTFIGDAAFDSCKKLTTVSIPKSVIRIDNYAFNQCYALDKVYYRGSEKDKNNITIRTGNDYLHNADWYYSACIGSYKHNYDNLGRCSICKATLYSIGDIDGDERVITTDLAILKLHLAGINTLDEIGSARADLNMDFSVNTTDLAKLKLILAGIE